MFEGVDKKKRRERKKENSYHQPGPEGAATTITLPPELQELQEFNSGICPHVTLKWQLNDMDLVN